MSDWIKDTLYPDGVLKNKYHIRDQQRLEQVEYLEATRRAAIFLHSKPQIKKIQDIKKIHKIMFGRLYDWAGKYRPGNFQKNGYDFCDHSRFEYAEANINNIMQNLPQKKALKATDYAQLLVEINFMHPFREGNGRSCKVFLSAYAANHGQVIDYPRKNAELIQAQMDADVGRISQLIKVQNMPSRENALTILANRYGKKKHVSD